MLHNSWQLYLLSKADTETVARSHRHSVGSHFIPHFALWFEYRNYGLWIEHGLQIVHHMHQRDPSSTVLPMNRFHFIGVSALISMISQSDSERITSSWPNKYYSRRWSGQHVKFNSKTKSTKEAVTGREGVQEVQSPCATERRLEIKLRGHSDW